MALTINDNEEFIYYTELPADLNVKPIVNSEF